MDRISTLLTLLCCTLPGSGSADAAGPSGSSGSEDPVHQTCSEGGESTLRIVLFDRVDLSAELVDSLKRSTESVFERLGVELEWLPPASPVILGDELKVLVMPAEPAAWGLSANTLGAVFGGGGGTIYLFEPAIRRALGLAAPRARFLSVAKQGLAYGRLLAHEVVHALAPDHPHADSGLMASSQQRYALTAPRFELDPESVDALCRGLRARAVSR